MVFKTKNHGYTPLNKFEQCNKICVWFPLHVFKDMSLFSALLSLRNSVPTEKRGNQDTYGQALTCVFIPPWEKVRNVLSFAFDFHAMCLKYGLVFRIAFFCAYSLYWKSVETRAFQSIDFVLVPIECRPVCDAVVTCSQNANRNSSTTLPIKNYKIFIECENFNKKTNLKVAGRFQNMLVPGNAKVRRSRQVKSFWKGSWCPCISFGTNQGLFFTSQVHCWS